MGKEIKNIWKWHCVRLVPMLATTIGAAIFGAVIVWVGVHLGADTYAQIGTILALMTALIFTVFVGAVSFGTDFNMTIQNGGTRNGFFVGSILTTMEEVVLELVLLFFLSVVESRLGKLLYPGMEMEGMAEVLLTKWLIPLSLFLLPAMRHLFGALLVRFQKAAWWLIWVIWMFGCVGMPRSIHYWNQVPDSTMGRVVHTVLNSFSHMSGGTVILLAAFVAVVSHFIVYRLIRRQGVVL